jgi:hypothetical protein
LIIAKDEFDILNATVNPTMLEQWRKDADYATKMRVEDVKVMDMYDVKAERST